MRLRAYILVSILLSVILHLLLLQATERVHFERAPGETLLHVSTVLTNLETTPKETPKKDDEAAAKIFADSKTLQQLSEDNLKPTPSDAEQLVHDILADAELLAPPKAEFVLEGVEALDRQAPDTEKMAEAATAPPPKIIEIERDSLSADRQVLPNRTMTAKIERFDIPEFNLPSLTAPGPLAPASGGVYGFSVKTGSRPQFALPEEDLGGESGVGTVPGELLPGLPEAQPTPLELGEIQETLPRGGELPKPFDQFVDIEVLVLRDKVGPGGYFQVSISPNQASDELLDIAKDSLFIIDHSASISHAKLVQFKEGTKEALQYLNPGDRFNIVSFTSRPRTLYDIFTPVTPESRKQGEDYVDGLLRGGMTDVFAGLAPFVSKGNGTPDRPVNIFLMTDGQSTVNIHESSFFLRQIYGRNPGNVSIFPFSAGKQANRELLDFLGYLNRGVKCHVDDVRDLSGKLVDFVNGHSSLIIADIRYTVDRDTGRDLYPRTLPHLYRHETLRLYGRFRHLSDELVLNLTGRDATHARRDLVFRRRYADCGPAPESLAQEWAGQKILHLIAARTWATDEAQRKACDQEIHQLTERYHVYTPY